MSAEDWSIVWLPLLGLLLLLAGYWGGVFYGTKPQRPDRLRAGSAAGPVGRLRAFAARVGERLAQVSRRLRRPRNGAGRVPGARRVAPPPPGEGAVAPTPRTARRRAPPWAVRQRP
jgi:hypothetical protein